MSTALTINGLTHALPAKSDAEWGGPLASLAHGLSYAKRAVVVFSASSGLSASVTSWAMPGYGVAASAAVSWPAPFTGSLLQAGLYIRARTAPDAFIDFDLQKNGSSITGFCRLNSGATSTVGGQFFTTPVTVTAGDLLSLSITPTGAYTSGAADLIIAFCLEAA